MAPLLSIFDPKRVLVVFTEDLGTHAEAVLSDVLRFLGLDPKRHSALSEVVKLHFNSRPTVALKPQQRISASIQRAMCQHFLPHNKALLTLLNLNRLPWRTCNHEHFTPYTAHGYSEEAKPKLHELSLVNVSNGLRWVRSRASSLDTSTVYVSILFVTSAAACAWQSYLWWHTTHHRHHAPSQTASGGGGSSSGPPRVPCTKPAVTDCGHSQAILIPPPPSTTFKLFSG